MSTLKDLLIHLSIETAKSKRTCKGKSKHSDKTIYAGQNCLRVKTGRFSSSVYCADCAKKMLTNANEKILLLQSEINK